MRVIACCCLLLACSKYEVRFINDGAQPITVLVSLSDDSASWRLTLESGSSRSVRFVPERASQIEVLVLEPDEQDMNKRVRYGFGFGYFNTHVDGEQCSVIRLEASGKMRGTCD